jgi:hypothetical protein
LLPPTTPFFKKPSKTSYFPLFSNFFLFFFPFFTCCVFASLRPKAARSMPRCGSPAGR